MEGKLRHRSHQLSHTPLTHTHAHTHTYSQPFLLFLLPLLFSPLFSFHIKNLSSLPFLFLFARDLFPLSCHSFAAPFPLCCFSFSSLFSSYFFVYLSLTGFSVTLPLFPFSPTPLFFPFLLFFPAFNDILFLGFLPSLPSRISYIPCPLHFLVFFGKAYSFFWVCVLSTFRYLLPIFTLSRIVLLMYSTLCLSRISQ